MQKKTIAKDIPLAEITLRRYEKPENMTERELARKVMLSLGLLQPGDSRDVIVDIFHVLLKNKKQKQSLPVEIIEKLVIQNRKEFRLPLVGIAQSNIRRQLKRLKDMLLVSSFKNEYHINEFLAAEEIFVEKIEKFLLASILSRTKEHLRKIDEMF